ncbi:hypothetical protein ccbrp13_05790 [Ktedonobacteria bacterium brp13]|nr:hypothetical protein ccbrp13_05790 [Ktedonobacteria bacterium brp13]
MGGSIVIWYYDICSVSTVWYAMAARVHFSNYNSRWRMRESMYYSGLDVLTSLLLLKGSGIHACKGESSCHIAIGRFSYYWFVIALYC